MNSFSNNRSSISQTSRFWMVLLFQLSTCFVLQYYIFGMETNELLDLPALRSLSFARLAFYGDLSDECKEKQQWPFNYRNSIVMKGKIFVFANDINR